MAKRKRISNGEKNEGKSIPDPPISLVRLLQKDKEVLNYFTALQRNLSNDVKRWKDKALEYKKQVEELGGNTTKKGTEVRKEKKGITNSRRKSEKKGYDQTPPLTTVQIQDGNQNDTTFQPKFTNSKVRKDDSSLSEDLKDDDESLDSLLKEEVATTKHKSHDIDGPLKDNTQRSMLNDEESSSSDSDFSELAREMSEQIESGDGPITTTIGTKRDVNDDNRTKKEIMDSIYEAYECLRYCGVSLVDVNPIEQGLQPTSIVEKAEAESMIPHTKSKNQSHISNEEKCLNHVENPGKIENGDENTMDDKKNSKQLKLCRRSDEDVIQDIFTCLRTLIRAPTLKENIGFECDPIARAWYQPFMTQNFIPASYEVDLKNSPLDDDEEKVDYQHPLVKGIEMIVRSLIIIDTYYVEILAKEEEFEKILQYSSYDTDTTRCIKEGMIHRNISSPILQSLEGEIVSNWARAERSIRSSVVTSEFAVDDEDSASDDEYVNQDLALSNGSCRFSPKLQNRMFLLLEKICLVRIVSSLLHHRRDEQRLFRLLIEYLISSIPSQALEDYPRFAPTMSMCIVEALTYVKEDRVPFLIHYCMEKFSGWHFQHVFCQTILCTHAIWKERMRSSDRKVREWAIIEDAAFLRLRERFHDWFIIAEMPEINLDAHGIVKELLDKTISTDIASSCVSIHLSLLLRENIEGAQEFCRNIMAMIQDHAKSGESSFVDHLSHVYSSAYNAVMILHERSWDAICVKGISADQVKQLASLDLSLESHSEMIWNLIQSDFLPPSDSYATLKLLIVLLLRMCMIAGDGYRSYKIANWLFCHQHTVQFDRTLFKSLALISKYPIVRVINLQSRQDRWKQIVTQSRQAQLLIVPAVASLTEESDKCDSFAALWGGNAICGKDVDHIDFEKQISSRLPSGKGIKHYVSSHWRPSDLKTFDSNAPQYDNLVRMSVSERACAFSHIFSWVGVKNSLTSVVGNDRGRLFPYRIAGYAQGPPLLVENEGMDPVPVCVILEDDALLVDQFRDKLEKLLLELPRDFHFCSLGYSRPKNAPMIHFSQRLGLPTCLWYLTGYILSLDGAEFLLNSLPCIGPVDSWIGLKIVSNWENDYGHRIGVGKVKASNDMSTLPKRKHLSDIIKFRAFAALSPLCSQKVAWRNPTSENVLRWRERDTDITYSGHQ